MSYGRAMRLDGEHGVPEIGSTGASPAVGKQTLVQMEYPYGTTIRAAVGKAVPGKAVLDPGGCSERGVPAFTIDLMSHFASPTPELHVAAHEAAHQLQHAGHTRDGGLGAERHANEVADAVVAGRSAEHLIGDTGSSVAPAERNYTELNEDDQNKMGAWKVGGTALVGDDGRVVTTSADKHACYAEPTLIVEANAILKTKKSGVNISPGLPGPNGFAPDGSGFKSTVKVQYRILSDSDNEEYLADCGHSARETMGPLGEDATPHGVYTDAAGKRAITASGVDPARYRDEIYVKGGLGNSGPAAHAAYDAMSPAAQDAFDKKHGINKYAAPSVGEAFTRRRDEDLGEPRGFNWHWGGVIMVAGGDRVTFENYTKHKGYNATDNAWYFAMYGPPTKPKQTWHEHWKYAVGGSAGGGTTIVAESSAQPGPFLAGAKTLSTAALIAKYRNVKEEAEKLALEAEMRLRWLKVTVQVKEAQEDEDEVYVVAEHRGTSYKSDVHEMNAGDQSVFWVSLDRFAPVTGSMLIKVYEEDTLSDDLISVIEFAEPFGLRTDSRPRDDAEYHTTVEFER